MGGIGIFLVVSAFIVLFPVVMQLRMGESTLSSVWGYLVFVAGLLIVAVGDSTVAHTHRFQLALAGVITALAGLLIQSRLAQSSNSSPRP
jgi:UDP-N-acetylmuramyl pentapeptide phosphotransferase/UDP-N-acetylglucosamine-1-phosphate transferase